MYPGAPDFPGDGIDGDCVGGDVAARVAATVAFKARYGRRSTKLTRVRVTEAPAHATVLVNCSGGRKKGCPKPRTFTTSAKGSVSLTRMFRKRLRVGARVTIAVTMPNAIGKVRELRVVRSDIKARTRCLPPGAVKTTKC